MTMKTPLWSAASQTTFPWSSRSKMSVHHLFPSSLLPLLFFRPHSPFTPHHSSSAAWYVGVKRKNRQKRVRHPKSVDGKPPRLAGNMKKNGKREKEIFFKYTMHFFWMRNNLFFIILNIYMCGVKKGLWGRGGHWSKLWRIWVCRVRQGKYDPICNANSLSIGVVHCLKPK